MGKNITYIFYLYQVKMEFSIQQVSTKKTKLLVSNMSFILIKGGK